MSDIMIEKINEPSDESQALCFDKCKKLCDVVMREINGTNFLEGLQIMSSINHIFLSATWSLLPAEAKILGEQMIRKIYGEMLNDALTMDKV